MKKGTIIITTVIILVASAAAYRFGIKVTTNEYSKQLEETQAMLAFNHLKRYEELLKCLENNKPSETTEKLKMSIISEKELIAEFLNKNNSEKINKYISIRYSKPIESLKSFKSNRGSRWSEPNCK